MSDIAIRVEGLGKKYRIGAAAPYHRLSEMMTGLGAAGVKALTAPFRSAKSNGHAASGQAEANPTEFWALKDINFEVKQGEVVGVIGRNGAGKSTLLKILSRITEPTTGRFGVKGRVASLLEVGTGFHPELTGRENIYTSGILLGMARAEVKKRFDEIVEFSGVEKFLDTPVKRYSSGMQVRLGFAVAAHLESEILIVDEVLAVGDAEFQERCLGKMGDVARSGRTVLFVSHNMLAVRSLCCRGLCLAHGKLIQTGGAMEVVHSYLEGNEESVVARQCRHWGDSDSPGTAHLRLNRVAINQLQGDVLDVASGFAIEIDAHCIDPVPHLDANIEIHNRDGVLLVHDGMVFTDEHAKAGRYRVTIEFPSLLFNAGSYSLTVFFGQWRKHLLLRVEDCLRFTLDHNQSATGTLEPKPGVLQLGLNKTCCCLDESLLEEAVL